MQIGAGDGDRTHCFFITNEALQPNELHLHILYNIIMLDQLLDIIQQENPTKINVSPELYKLLRFHESFAHPDFNDIAQDIYGRIKGIPVCVSSQELSYSLG